MNFDYDSKDYCTLIFVGQNEFLRTLRLKSLEPFRQRINMNYTFTGFNEEEVRNYVVSRLQSVNCRNDLFRDECYHTLYSLMNTSVRILNLLINKSLILGMHYNKEYIDRYIESGKYKGPDYTYNSENAFTDNKQESQIFQDFLNSFENEAGNIDDGTNWFIHGKLPTLPPMTYPINNAGYFKDVFPEGVRLGKNIAGIGKETFNKTIKDALLNNKAIGFNAGNVKSSHAMTIWGAEFDENGDISYIYYVDNNDRSDVRYFGCIRVKIVYPKMPEGGNTTGYKYGYIGEPEDSYKPINRLFTLELGTEYWKKYFNE